MNSLTRDCITVHYTPERFALDYFALQGSNQYPMFAAVVLDVKPSYDDWVDTRNYSRFVEMCSRYGLHVEPDVVFTTPPDKRGVVGAICITTTYSAAQPFRFPLPPGRVHVFVARSEAQAREAKRYGWYPVVINNRVVNKPFVDHLRFGNTLGFPDCCIEGFRKYNDWSRFCHPLESLRNTPRDPHHAIGSHLCNNFLMDNTCSFIHHTPCSYRCAATIELASRIRDAISAVEPGFVSHATKILMMPLLVLGERNYVIFDGTLAENTIHYRAALYVRNPARPEEVASFADSLPDGNRSSIVDGTLRVMDGKTLILSVPARPEWFLIGWD
jgi:hypothetical protein